jgi:hypothetical protein
MQIQSSRFKFLSATLALALTLTPEMFAQQAGVQQQSQQPQQQNAQPAPATAQPETPTERAAPASQAPTGTTVNPSQPPLQPVTTYPGASETQQDQANTPAENENAAKAPEAPQPKQQPSQPVGAATAERVPTRGGAAAKPAGAAIAPAKQHQTRSLLIKIGAIAAAGAALGTVYALSRGTSSTPPNATAGVPK